MIEDIKNELDDELVMTENGALAYKTSGKKLMDLNFAVGSFRNKSADFIYKMFFDAYIEDKDLAMKWLFYCRDCRGGIGERKAFRIILQKLAENHEEELEKVLCLVPKYGRWDDLWCLLDTSLKPVVIRIVEDQLMDDLNNHLKGESISLLAKWMPSCNASSKKTRRYASILFNGLGYTKKFYIKLLKDLRSYLDVVETKISKNKWDEVVYENVPSYANLLYRNAFIRHDEERRSEYLEKLENGETKINSKVLFPHDIVHRYSNSDNEWYCSLKKYDKSLEELWKNLPDYVDGENNTLVIRDGSGSMLCNVGHSKLRAITVSTALAIYFSERCSGEFKDKFITFSNSPELVDLSSATSLFRKIEICNKYDDYTSTDLHKTFKLLLDVAVKNDYSQDQLPKNLLIISDMEFNEATDFYFQYEALETLFGKINKEYASYGYKLPRLIFWNVCSRTNSIPIKENDLGICLVSGFSPAVVSMVLSDELDPYKCLLDILNSDRYKTVGEALNYD